MRIKGAIVHESQNLFSLKGFSNTGIKDIIEAAGTTKGGFYNHFASKEELFYEVLSEAQQVWRERVLTAVREIDSPMDRIIFRYVTTTRIDKSNPMLDKTIELLIKYLRQSQG